MDMNYVLIAVALIAGFLFVSGGKFGKGKMYKYQMKSELFSTRERVLMDELERCCEVLSLKLMGKVRIADVLMPKRSFSKKQRVEQTSEIGMHSFDFLACDSETLQPIMVIELDNDKVKSVKARRREKLIKACCEGAELPLLKIPLAEQYDINEIKAMMEECI